MAENYIFCYPMLADFVTWKWNNQKVYVLLSSYFFQTNVYASAQRRKMSYFTGFIKKAVVVIPPHHELRKRTARRNEEMGQPVPDDAINAMKGELEWCEWASEGEGVKMWWEGRRRE